MTTYQLTGKLYVAYSPVVDRKWLPRTMVIGRWYEVVGVEVATLTPKEPKEQKDTKESAALFYHFVGSGCIPSRVIQGNAVIATAAMVDTQEKRDNLWTAILRELSPSDKGNSGASA